MLNYAFSLYEVRRPVVRGHKEADLLIDHRPGARLPVVAGRTIRKVVRTDQSFALEKDLPKRVEGPLHAGDQVGTLKVTLDGEMVDEVPLLARLDVPKAGAARQIQDFLTKPSTLGLFGVLLILAAVLLSRMRSEARRQETPA
jgi:D-alanyl-D-alanine carboxypeptidase (penicillin-binding protein 5/6)